MAEQYDVGILVHFPDGVSERVEIDVVELAGKWQGQVGADWPFSVALLPVGEFLGFVFPDPDNANLFVSSAERYLRSVTAPDDVDLLYSIVICWNGVIGGPLS